MDRKNSLLFDMNAAAANGQSPAMTKGNSPSLPVSNQDLRKSYGTNWTKANVSVLFEWVTIAAYNIRCLELAIAHYRIKIRTNTILALVLSTLSGTTALAGFPNVIPMEVTIILNSLFIVMSFTIAIMTGYVKIFHIQENLELNIKIKQEWISFSTEIASELQLPIELRKDALWMIIKNKGVYLELLKVNLDIPKSISKQAQKDFNAETKLNMDVSSLSRILIDIVVQEMRDIELDNKDDRISSVAKKQLTHFITQPPAAPAWKIAKKISPLESISETTETPQLIVEDTQVVTLNMNDSPTHPHLEVRPT
jgi:hypothetical protein